MTKIEKILVEVKTGSSSGAGTDGYVYLGIAGREFLLDTRHDDFEKPKSTQGTEQFVLGLHANAIQNSVNDPRSLYINYIEQCPVYIRFEPAGVGPDWQVESVWVTVNPTFPSEVKYRTLAHGWLGQNYGKWLFLVKTI